MLLVASSDKSAAAVGGTYEFTRFASANLREKDDSLNTAIGGFLAGSVLGLRCERLYRAMCPEVDANLW
jgi:Tim17/Tim22/Tim23/Pmp24 family